MPDPELCHCGRPLHYVNNYWREYVEKQIEQLGPRVKVTVSGRSFMVPRHYIALHGLKGNEVRRLGFEEVTP